MYLCFVMVTGELNQANVSETVLELFFFFSYWLPFLDFESSLGYGGKYENAKCV